MRLDRNIYRNRMIAFMMVILIPIIMLVCTFTIASEVGHVCMGEHCPICSHIEQCENMLHRIVDGVTNLILAVFPLTLFLLPVEAVVAEVPTQSLVSKKIRLND
ncbi:MAG: hypothetical protein K6G07_04410 [Lachnospiraceae bacterium]|nr:hypothetical protein [Lachnospiraceae bacterium]